ncbi:MAG: hypothetical protein H7A46_10220 [Verrucomicrobiales bacterium]|nr:hypothetical protein [Verrucomicrobiales bacterium]
MKHDDSSNRLTRRRFLLRGAATGAATAALAQLREARAAGVGAANPFAYSVSEFEVTDPALLKYREVRRFEVPGPEARRLTLLPGGSLLVAAGRRFVEMTAEGSTVREIAVNGAARCAAVAGDGTVYAGVQDHVEVFSAKGERLATWQTPGKRSWISGLAVGENEVFAADSGARLIWRHDRSGKATGRIGERDAARNVPGFVLPSPFLDVELAEDGLLRVNNPGRHRVEFYTPAGSLEFAWGEAGMAIDRFSGCCNPCNLALLGNGTVITCEKGLPRVKLHGTHGEFEGVVAGTESFPENAKTGAGDGPGTTNRASLDAVADATGRIHILDTVTRRVHVMEPKQPT